MWKKDTKNQWMTSKGFFNYPRKSYSGKEDFQVWNT